MNHKHYNTKCIFMANSESYSTAVTSKPPKSLLVNALPPKMYGAKRTIFRHEAGAQLFHHFSSQPVDETDR